tara:strand:- start:1026 stop:2309 length:1284 start_codon:yes stop_codon:yes gene_type:complete
VQFNKSTNIIPALAYRWEIKSNSKEYKFFIRQNVNFHNGEYLNSSIIQRSFERILDKSLYQNIAKISTSSDSTIIFSLYTPEPAFLSKLAMPMASIVLTDTNKNVYGTGPWKLNEWINDGHIILHRNDRYYNRKANYERLIIRIINDPFPRVASFKTGYIDILEIPDSEKKIWEYNSDFDSMIKNVDQLNTYYIGLNCERPPFNNKRVRQALNYAIDIDKIIKHLKGGYATKAIGPIPPELQKIKNREKYLYNPQIAKSLLEEAGYLNGFSVELWQTQDPEILNISEIIQSELKKIGIDITIVTRDWNSLSSAVRGGVPDMFYRSWYADYPDAENFLIPLFESEISQKKWTRYSNKKLDIILNLISRESNNAKRDSLIFKAHQIVINDAPWIFLWHEKNSYITQPWIKNWEPAVMFNAEKYIRIKRD